MEKILSWLENPLVLLVLGFVVGNGLKKLPSIWKVIVYLVIEAIEHLIFPVALRKMVKKTVHNILTERQRKLLDEALGNKGYLHRSEKK